MVDYLISCGIIGMLITAFLAGSFFPFPSEVVLTALYMADVSPIGLLIAATIGNTCGGFFNYCIGRLGKEEWIIRYWRVSPKKLERGRRQVKRYGAWAGMLAWIPFLGSVVTVGMGLMRTRLTTSVFSIFLGDFVRYIILFQILKHTYPML